MGMVCSCTDAEDVNLNGKGSTIMKEGLCSKIRDKVPYTPPHPRE